MKKLNTLAKLSIATTMAFGAVAPTAMMMATPIHAQEVVGMVDTNNVQNLEVKLVNEAKWTGSPVEQKVQIVNGAHTLVEGVDYVLEGNVQTEYGVYTLTVKGIGEYHGEQQVQWVLSKDNTDIVNICNCNITLVNKLVASGTQQIQVTNGDKVLQEGVDYTVSGNQASAPGTYTMTVTGMGQFTGSVNVEYSVEGAVMKTVNMKDCKVALTNQLTANGNNQTQNVSVSYNGQALAQGTDYSVSGNVAKAAGTYTMTITGNGIYKGSVQVKYTVAAAKEEKKQDTTKKEDKNQANRKESNKIAVKEEDNTNVGFFAAILAGLTAIVAAIAFFFKSKRA